MSEIKVDLEIEIIEQWAHAQGTIAQGIKRAVENACTEGAQEARTVRRWKDRTGETLKGIEGKLDTFDHLGAEGHIQSKAKHSSFLEDGTKPHRIEAKNAKALRWEGEGGVVHFARAVNHPGTKPMPFMGPAYLKAERVLERDITVAVAKAEEELK